MNRAVIVDDEEDSREVLKKLLQKFCPQIQLEAEFDNINDAYTYLSKNTVDVVFLDVQMPGGNGFKLLSKFEKLNFDVIFVTSYDHYALDAIRLSALHYLIKPVVTGELCEAVKRLEEKHRNLELLNTGVSNLQNNLSAGTDKKVAIHARDQVTLLKLSEITHLESERNYTCIYTDKNEKYVSSKNLGEYEEMLSSYPEFLRISKSFIVNVNFVSSYSKGAVCYISVNKLHQFEVSRRKKHELLTRMGKL